MQAVQASSSGLIPLESSGALIHLLAKRDRFTLSEFACIAAGYVPFGGNVDDLTESEEGIISGSMRALFGLIEWQIVDLPPRGMFYIGRLMGEPGRQGSTSLFRKTPLWWEAGDISFSALAYRSALGAGYPLPRPGCKPAESKQPAPAESKQPAPSPDGELIPGVTAQNLRDIVEALPKVGCILRGAAAALRDGRGVDIALDDMAPGNDMTRAKGSEAPLGRSVPLTLIELAMRNKDLTRPGRDGQPNKTVLAAIHLAVFPERAPGRRS